VADAWSYPEQGLSSVPTRLTSPNACPRRLLPRLAGTACTICSPALTVPPLFLTNIEGTPSLCAHPTAKNGSKLPSTPKTAMTMSNRPATRTHVALVKFSWAVSSRFGTAPYPTSASLPEPGPGKLTVRFSAPGRGGDLVIGRADIKSGRTQRGEQWRERRRRRVIKGVQVKVGIWTTRA
jgi:hypothetical protein